MRGISTICRKELSDHFSSYRFLILFGLIMMVSVITAFLAGMNMSKELAGFAKPKFVFLMLFTSSGIGFSLVQFVAFFGPLIGLILGFDTINRERNEGTLSKILAQPVYRDSVVNAKFLSGVMLITIMISSIVMIITGVGLMVIGVVPGPEEIFRLLVYVVLSIVYISFWLGVSILFSIMFRSVATSALAALATWIFFSFFVSIGADAVANSLTPDAGPSNPEASLLRIQLKSTLYMASPMELYTNASAGIIDPMRRTSKSFIQLGMMEQLSMSRFSGPLSMDQSLLVVLPYIISLIGITTGCFVISYIIFMRQEIRSV